MLSVGGGVAAWHMRRRRRLEASARKHPSDEARARHTYVCMYASFSLSLSLCNNIYIYIYVCIIIIIIIIIYIYIYIHICIYIYIYIYIDRNRRATPSTEGMSEASLRANREATPSPWFSWVLTCSSIILSDFLRISPEFHQNTELVHPKRGDNHNSAFPHTGMRGRGRRGGSLSQAEAGQKIKADN